MNKYLINAVVMLFLPQMCLATVGGAESLEVLGFDQKDQKIFLARHYADASGRLPTLYYYHLASSQPHKLIEVKSLYKQIDRLPYTQVEKHFNREFKKIQSRLLPLQPLNTNRAKIQVIQRHFDIGHYWHTSHPDDEFDVKRYKQTYIVNNAAYKSATAQSISFIDPKLELRSLYALPQNNKKRSAQIAIIRYQGIPVEMGYSKEDALLLLDEKKR